MKILDSHGGLLTNYEVLRSLQEQQMARYDIGEYRKEVRKYRAIENKGKHLKGKVFFGMSQKEKELSLKCKEAGRDLKKCKQIEHICWTRDKVISYLSRFSAGVQTDEHITAFLTAAKNLLETANLTQAEILSLINLRPSTLVEIHRVIEECEERLTEEQVEELLQYLQQTLPAPPVSEDDAKTSERQKREQATSANQSEDTQDTQAEQDQNMAGNEAAEGVEGNTGNENGDDGGADAGGEDDDDKMDDDDAEESIAGLGDVGGDSGDELIDELTQRAGGDKEEDE